MPTMYVTPGRSVMGFATAYGPFPWPRDPTHNTPISPFGEGGEFPDNKIVQYSYSNGHAITINDEAEAAWLAAAGFVSATPTVTPSPPGPPASKLQGVVASYVVRGTVYLPVTHSPFNGPSTGRTPGQKVLLSQSDTDRLTALGMLSPTPPA